MVLTTASGRRSPGLVLEVSAVVEMRITSVIDVLVTVADVKERDF